MGDVVYTFSVSVDGYIETRDKSLDWCIIDEEFHVAANEEARQADVLLYGRRLYELMASFWPTADEDPRAEYYIADFAKIWREKPKVVVSKTLDEVKWNGRLVRENLAGEVAALKEQYPGDIGVGGAELAGALIDLDLVDEFRMQIHPVILGGGTPYFPDSGKRYDLELVEVRPYGSGVVSMRYRRRIL